MQNQFKKMVVTGGAGFIGSHLVERLIKEGLKVVVIDNMFSGRLSNLASVIGNPNLEIIQEDISNRTSIEPHFENTDTVFHLAARADIVPSIQKPEDYYQANVTGTLNVLESARKFGVRRFIYIASSSCYGIPDKYPTDENATIRPQYPYALTKYLGEQTALHWGQVYKMNTVSLRLFNVFGPRHRTTGTYGAVFGVFLAQKKAGVPLTIVGDGKQTRDFTYVGDVVEAIITAWKSDVKNEVFNVGSGNTYPVNLLADLLGGERVFIPKRPGEPDCTFADISKIKRLLNWVPQIKFKDGVKNMLATMEDYSNAPVWTPSTIQEATKEWFQYLG